MNFKKQRGTRVLFILGALAIFFFIISGGVNPEPAKADASNMDSRTPTENLAGKLRGNDDKEGGVISTPADSGNKKAVETGTAPAKAETQGEASPDSLTPPNLPLSKGGQGGVIGTVPETKVETAPVNERASLEEKWGVRVVALKLSAAGNVLDFRYRVTDVEKAKPLFDKKVKPYIIDQTSGAKLLVPKAPKIGALRQTPRNPVAGKNFFVLFANPGQLVKAGNKVTVVIGDFKAENLTVQ